MTPAGLWRSIDDNTGEAKAEFELLKKSAPNHPETLQFEAQLAFNDKDYKDGHAGHICRVSFLPGRIFLADDDFLNLSEFGEIVSIRQRIGVSDADFPCA